MLELSQLVKTVPGGRRVLDGVSFEVRPGEFVGILGPSGAGKSLTIRSIVGMTELDSGEVVFSGEAGRVYRTTHVKGRELRKARRQIGVIFQGLHLVKALTVLENVMIGRLGYIHPLRSWLYGFKDAEAQDALQALAQVQMADFADRKVANLSGGEMQRVAIARAIHQRPRLYLADEPIASLDPRNAEGILKLLRPLAQNSPVVGTFHQPEMTRRYCTRVIGIRAGRVVYDGSPNLSRSQLVEIYGAELDSLENLAEVQTA
jgi:phosphonate transport system ATP-binding protein